MNERIQKLLEQARTECSQFGSKSATTVGYDELEKFAELIMREFIGILEEEINLVEEFKSTSVKADVIKCHTSKIYHFHKLIDKSKKHFGVEE